MNRDGSIDWLCWPQFDSDACFAALLGDERHGCWSLSPRTGVTGRSRRYESETLVLQTDTETATGTYRITDFMPIRSGDRSSLVRIVEGLSCPSSSTTMWRGRASRSRPDSVSRSCSPMRP